MAQNNHTDGEVKETFYHLVGKYLPKVKSGDSETSLPVSSAANSVLTELVKPYLLDPFCFPLMQKNLTGKSSSRHPTAKQKPVQHVVIIT